jgi:BR serine/threonine kinase
MHEILESQRHLYLVLEHASHGELFEYLSARGQLPPSDAIRLFRQIIYGVDYLHAHSICHRDLKLENILLDEHDNVKIADFGFARWMQSNVETSCGSPHYAAPDVIAGKPYDGRKADIWSCGVILYTLLVGRLPFDEPSLHDLAAKICAGQFRMPDFADRQIADLIAKLLSVRPHERPGIEKIKRHPFFRSGIPRAYTCPSPLPLAATIPAPSALDGPTWELFESLGYRERADVIADLQSGAETMAKSFWLMLTNKGSFDDLPWPTDDASDASSDSPESEIIVAGFDFAAAAEQFAAQSIESCASLSSLAEVPQWDPALLARTREAMNVAYLGNIRMPLEAVVAAVQKWLIGSGFEWFYPNDLLLLARKRQAMDLTIEVEWEEDAELKITARLMKGDALDFNALVMALGRVINEVM